MLASRARSFSPTRRPCRWHPPWGPALRQRRCSMASHPFMRASLSPSWVRRRHNQSRPRTLAAPGELYAKFGIAAEAAQLFEVELGSLLLCARAIEQGWGFKVDGDQARKLLRDIDRSTLGHLLGSLSRCVELDDALADRFASALQTRN